jgi:crotonobetainyl-CoA:carnitine CoA-transferase CaiB-like acyl-CoA transferase
MSKLIDHQLEQWTAFHAADKLESLLKAAGVSAERVRKANDLVSDPAHRNWIFKELEDPPTWTTIVPAAPFRFESPLPALQRAPHFSEHSAAILQEWLGLNDRDIAQLLENGALEAA